MSNQSEKPDKLAIFVRHAKTDFNILGGQGRFCGVSDPDLNEEGIVQAERTAYSLVREGITKIITSPLRRCRSTAEIIARQLHLQIEDDERLREIDYGSWEGLTKDEIQLRFREKFESFSRDPIGSVPPHGESPLNVLRRVEDLMGSLRNEVTLLVGHKTAMRLLLCKISGVPLDQYRSFSDLHLSSITKILIQKPPRITVLDDRAHLVGQSTIPEKQKES
jgi:broad specificity phosphatase PhoE